MSNLSIGDVASQAGLATSAIRYYEELGLLEEPIRVGGRRRYDSSILQRLSIILLARQVGFSLEEIQVLMNGFPKGTLPDVRWRTLVPRKLQELDTLSAKIESMRKTLLQTLQCGCATLEECASGVGGMACGEPSLQSILPTTAI